MYQKFDYFGLFEKPEIILTNPDGTELYTLENIKNVNLKLRFNAIGEISFEAAKTINGVDMEYYDYLTYRRYILVENIALFMITGVQEDANGYSDIKTITAQDASVELVYKHLDSSFSGTYKFFDLITPAPTLLGKILSYLPGWTVGEVDTELLSIYRTFSVTDQTIYNFLSTDAENAFGVIFVYDTLHRTISAHTIKGATSQTDIFISFSNIIKSTKLTEVTDGLVTCLDVTGAGDLSVNQINPLGNNKIFNLSYYEQTSWMPQTLIDALHAWESNVAIQQPIYANLLTQLEQQNTDLINYNATLVTLQGELAALTDVMGARIQQGLSITAIKAQIKAKKAEISAEKALIASKQSDIDATTAQLKIINDSLSFNSNFTSDQQTLLSKYIIENSYNNTSFVQTDSMSLVSIQQEAQDLYDLAESLLARISQPMYTFDLESTNFLFLEKFAPFSAQLELGSVITLELANGTFAYPIILEIDLQLDNASNFKLTFGNRLRLDKSNFIYADLFGDSIKGGLSANSNSIQYGNFDKNYKNDVQTFLNDALDASKNAVINASSQNIIIDSAGIRGRYLDPLTNDYADQQFWMINNMLVFTDDNWDTASLALGEISTPSGSAWGLAAGAIVGNLIAGNELIITNETSTFTVTGSSINIVDGNIALTRSDGAARMYIDPSVGIDIEQRNPSTGSYTSVFYVDQYGNLIFTGNLQGATGTFSGAITALSGTIGGWQITENGLSSPFGDYINSNGNIRLGPLQIQGSEGVFNGNFYANNLQGLLQASQIGSLNADVINAGTLSAIKIYGCDIEWDGVKMYAPTPYNAVIQSTESLALSAGYQGYGSTYSAIDINKTFINLFSNTVMIGNQNQTSQVFINGQIIITDAYFNKGTGISGTYIF